MEQISRRQALIMTAASCAACAMCGVAGAEEPAKEAPAGGDKPKAKLPEKLNIGKIEDFTKTGFYGKFLPIPIIIANVDNRLVAISARCTHKGATVAVKDEKTLRCPAHKAEYAEHGQPASGPAKSALSRYALKAGADGNIVVDTTKVFPEKEWDKEGAFIELPKA